MPVPPTNTPDARGRPRLGRILFSADQIRQRLDALAAEIARDYGTGDLAAVAVLKGSFVFLADLARLLSNRGIHLTIDFMTVSSYGTGTASAGTATVREAPGRPLNGQPVLLIDDILDTGLTLQTARDILIRNGAGEVRCCVLLDKPARRRIPSKADYAAFRIEDVFAVGYGLDYNDRFRHLPYLATLVFDGPAQGEK